MAETTHPKPEVPPREERGREFPELERADFPAIYAFAAGLLCG